MRGWMVLSWALVWVGCSASGGDPCARLCDGIVRCRQGNADCVASGMTAREPFYDRCITQCETTSAMLSADEVDSALLCLDCLDAQTNFGSCNGELLLDDTCAATCRSGGAIPFRNDFGPALFTGEFECLRAP